MPTLLKAIFLALAALIAQQSLAAHTDKPADLTKTTEVTALSALAP